MMKAAVYEKYGDSEVLQVREIRRLTANDCASTDVLVRIHSAAINPVDWKILGGYLRILPNCIKAKPSKETPAVLGFDFSGVIVAKGNKVEQFALNDQVFGMADFRKCGTFAEYAVISAHLIAKKPSNLSFNEAASIPLVALTSYQSLFTCGGLLTQCETQQKVLIIGGSGGTGIMAIQMARDAGAHVTAVCSGKNKEFVQELGANQVIDYTKNYFADVLKHELFDVIYDCVGGKKYYLDSYPLLKKSGTFVSIIGDSEDYYLGISNLLKKGWQKVSRLLYSYATWNPMYCLHTAVSNSKDLNHVKDMIEKGTLKPIIDSVYPFDDIATAVERSTTRRARGKIVLEIFVV